MDLHNEEDVKIKFLVGLLAEHGYDVKRIRYNVTIEVKQGRKKKTIFADAVVDGDETGQLPLVVVETKGPNEPLTIDDRDQGISYARLHTPIVPLVLLTNGKATKVYDTFTKKEIKGGLPTRDNLIKSLKRQRLSDEQRGALMSEAQHELFRVDDVQEFKRILRASHNAIRNNEGYDPTKAFDELSKVMFCKLHEEKRTGENRFRISVFDDALKRIGTNVVQTIFNETKADKKYAGLFQPEDTIELNDRTIRELVRQFENYDLSLTEFDVKGEAFEHFLGDTFTGGLGQYFTPRNVVRFMIDALEVRVGDKVIDPFCGTGGFLIYAYAVVAAKIRGLDVSDDEKAKYLKALAEECLYGVDWNERTSQACRMNMSVHGEGEAGRNIYKESGFIDIAGSIDKGTFDVCATNPPFGSSETDPDILGAFELGAGRKSLERAALALERAIELVRPGGRIGIVIMDGILSNRSMQGIRDFVLQNAKVLGLVSLPSETFEGYGGRSNTTILLLERKAEKDESGKQDPVFMAVCQNSGYAPNGAEVPGNELPAILDAYRQWQRGQDFDFPNAWVAEITGRLDPKHYWRPTAAVGVGADEHVVEARSTVDGLADVLQEIAKRAEGLAKDIPTREVRLGDVLEEIVDRQSIDQNRTYDLAGVRWWGGGAFIRETKLGRDIKATKHSPVVPGALIYNRLFAFRGSFAIVGDDCAGAFVSNEFPMFQVRDDVEEPGLLLRYLVHALNSPRVLDIVNAHSSGSTKTSRNRLNQREFEDLKIAVPESVDDMRDLVGLMDLGDEFRLRQEDGVTVAKRLRDGLAGMLPVD